MNTISIARKTIFGFYYSLDGLKITGICLHYTILKQAHRTESFLNKNFIFIYFASYFLSEQRYKKNKTWTRRKIPRIYFTLIKHIRILLAERFEA